MKKPIALLTALVLLLAMIPAALASGEVIVLNAPAAITLLKTGAEKIDSFPSFTATIPQSAAGVVYPVKASQPGMLYFQVAASVPYTVYLKLYSDPACAKEISYSFGNCAGIYSSIKNGENGTVAFYVSSAATYYLKFFYSYGTYETAGTLTFKAYQASSADRTLADNTYTVGAPYQSNQVTYYRINVAQAGYIGITQENPKNSSNSLYLLKSDKKTALANKNVDGATYYYPVKKGTYYIKTNGPMDTWYSVKYSFLKQTASALTIKNNKAKTLRLFDSADYYLRFKAEKTGSITLTNQGQSASYITLCNSKKTALSEKTFLGTSGTMKSTSFAVTKGKVYHFKINGTYSDSVTLKYKIKGSSITKNNTKAKATTLKKNKNSKFTLPAGTKKAHWYKFTQSGGKKLDLDVTCVGTGSYNITVYRGSKKTDSLTIGAYRKTNITSLFNLSKGTYYLKIVRKDKLSNGTATLRLKS